MAKHEFGIMQEHPQKWQRYDEYDPQSYNCISVNDDYLEDIVVKFNGFDLYWHTLDVPAKGIAYAGITLIPPTSIPALITVIENIYGLSELKVLLQNAYHVNKWVIHFGL